MLALDVDGTLLTSGKTISKATRMAIKELLSRGIYVTLATGRPYPSAKAVAAQLGLRIPLVSHDGAYVADPLTDHVLYVKRIPALLAFQLTRHLAEYGLEIMLQHETFCATNHRWSWREIVPVLHFSSLRLWLHARYKVNVLPTRELADFVQACQLSPPKVFVMGKREQLEAARNTLTACALPGIRITSSGENNLEILPEGVSKASGLKIVTSQLGIGVEQVVAVGDHYNDVEMLGEVGLGVAMGNAPAAVKRSARFVTGSNDQDGVASLIAKLF